MFNGARRAYDSGVRTSASGRELEAAALNRAARQLEACQRDWDREGGAERLAQALRYNQRLWTFFQGEMMVPECLLPRQLRVNLLHLSRFVDQRTFQMISEPTREGLQALIDFVREIAAGLSTAAADTADAAATAPAA